MQGNHFKWGCKKTIGIKINFPISFSHTGRAWYHRRILKIHRLTREQAVSWGWRTMSQSQNWNSIMNLVAPHSTTFCHQACGLTTQNHHFILNWLKIVAFSNCKNHRSPLKRRLLQSDFRIPPHLFTNCLLLLIKERDTENSTRNSYANISEGLFWNLALAVKDNKARRMIVNILKLHELTRSHLL